MVTKKKVHRLISRAFWTSLLSSMSVRVASLPKFSKTFFSFFPFFTFTAVQTITIRVALSRLRKSVWWRVKKKIKRGNEKKEKENKKKQVYQFFYTLPISPVRCAMGPNIRLQPVSGANHFKYSGCRQMVHASPFCSIGLAIAKAQVDRKYTEIYTNNKK